MSIVTSIEDFVQGIENAVGSEVDKIGSGLDSAVASFAALLSTALENQFAHINALIATGKSDIDADIIALGGTLATVKATGEAAIESVFADAVKNVKKLSDDITAVGMLAVNTASDATAYVRTTARNDLIGAATAAKTTFD